MMETMCINTYVRSQEILEKREGERDEWLDEETRVGGVTNKIGGTKRKRGGKGRQRERRGKGMCKHVIELRV